MLRQTDRKEREAEAEAKGVQQEYNPDPEIVIKIKGKYERIRKSKLTRKKEIGLFNKPGNKIKTR